jgi:uncharacterized membrane protein
VTKNTPNDSPDHALQPSFQCEDDADSLPLSFGSDGKSLTRKHGKTLLKTIVTTATKNRKMVVIVLRLHWIRPCGQRRLQQLNESRPVMHRILVIVFDNEAKADEGKNELLRLDDEGSIGIYGYEAVAKKQDGTVVIRQAYSHGTLSPFGKSLLGSLSDSTCSTTGPAATKAASPPDSDKTETGEAFVRDVMEVLLPNRVAIVAEVEEEWPMVLDRSMDPAGGVVFRWTVSEQQHEVEM